MTDTPDHDAQEETEASIEETTEPEETQDGQGEAETDDDDSVSVASIKAKLSKANREARNLRKRIKDLEPLAQKAQQHDDAAKSETQRLTEQLATAEEELSTLRSEKIRNEAGREAKLDPELWEFITSSDPDEALEQAKRLAARITRNDASGGPANLRQGSRQPAKTAPSPNDALRFMAGRTN